MPGCLTILVAIITTTLAALLRPPRRYEVPPGGDVYAVVSGTWNWADRTGGCDDNPFTLSFSPDRETMLLRYARPPEGGVREVRYELRAVTRSGVRGAITGETRLTPAGEPVVWDLVLTSPDTYRWHRTDWPDGSFTPEVRRCGHRTDADSWLPLASDDTVAIELDTTSIREATASGPAVQLRYTYRASRDVPVLRGVAIPDGVRYTEIVTSEYAVCNATRRSSFAIGATFYDSTGRLVGRSFADVNDGRGFPSISGAAGPPLCAYLARRTGR